MKKTVNKMNDKRKKVNLKSKSIKINKPPHRQLIYGLYTDRGFKYRKGGKSTNFISYVKRSQFKFDEISPDTNNIMMDQIRNRKKKLEKLLGMKISIRMSN